MNDTNTTAKLTIKHVKAELAAIGIKLHKTACGEFRVRHPQGGDGYHTPDLADAFATGKEMAREWGAKA